MGRIRAWLVVMVLGSIVAGCSSTPGSGGIGRFLGPAPKDTGPPADSPLHLLDAYQWCWENLNETRYRELFTADYIFEFSPTDSSGSAYHDSPWRREDELIFAHNLFVAGSASEAPASSITLTFSGTSVDRDLRPGKTYPVHQTIATRYNLKIQTTIGTGFQCSGDVRFYMVRGDSASIPADLGVTADSARWYIERLADESLTGQQPASVLPRTRALATHPISFGWIRSLYR